jgi:16S rRNA (cytosine967-C5)-methyltransferase
MLRARDVARKVLRRVDEGAYTTLALSGELAKASHLSPLDRALVTELVYGVLKRRRRLDYALAAGAPRGLASLDGTVLDALRLGAYQLLFLRIPSHAAVDDAVEAVKRLRGPRLAGFVNALLRRVGSQGEPPPPSELRARLGVEQSAPDWLVAEALRRFDEEEATRLLAAFNEPAPIWLRANRLRSDPEALRAQLTDERPTARLRGPAIDGQAPDALALEGGGDPSTTRAFGEGLCTVQDLAAQRVTRLLDPQPGQRLLDACSGVGGKATYLAELTREAAQIDAADLSARKLDLARDHARRLGLSSLRFLECDLARTDAPLAARYDGVLLDAPCSGLGVLRRHPEAKWRPRPEGLDGALPPLQARLLALLAQRVAPGGLLVYSVCTFVEAEGSGQIARFLASRSDFRLEGEPLATWPHRDDADAFFAARLRRVG